MLVVSDWSHAVWYIGNAARTSYRDGCLRYQRAAQMPLQMYWLYRTRRDGTRRADGYTVPLETRALATRDICREGVNNPPPPRRVCLRATALQVPRTMTQDTNSSTPPELQAAK